MSNRRFLAYLTVLLLGLSFGAPRLFAGDGGLRLEAVLVWGTHVAKTNDANLKELEPQLAKKLHKAYKWENYYEVRRKETKIAGKDIAKVPSRETCHQQAKQNAET